MSVIACYARLNSESLDACRAAPDWVETLYAKTFPSAEVIDIDEACDGIVWLLTRVPAPANANVESTGFVVRRSLAPLLRGQSGLREGQLDAGHGPASTLSNQQVAELSAWLQSIDPVQMRSRYDPHAMDNDGVYPQIWFEEGVAAFDDYLLPHFRGLQAFFLRAAQAQQPVLVFFT